MLMDSARIEKCRDIVDMETVAYLSMTDQNLKRVESWKKSGKKNRKGKRKEKSLSVLRKSKEKRCVGLVKEHLKIPLRLFVVICSVIDVHFWNLQFRPSAEYVKKKPMVYLIM